jgi:Zn-dependent peptidase ImmA (M78 family)
VSRVEIEEAAQSLLKDLAAYSAPVSLEQVVERLGYKLVYRFFDDYDLSGTVIRDAQGEIVIGINTLHSHVRQRFSIAHEVGHATMHLLAGEDLIVDPPTRRLFNRDHIASLGEDPREIEANQFAAALLMPAPLVGAIASDILSTSPKPTMEDLCSSLAARFDVSTQAMKFRLVNLGVIEPD